VFIYLIRNKINGKEYVGQTIQCLGKRWYAHLNGKRCPIDFAIRKYDSENFELKVLAIPNSLEEMNLGEEAHILARNCLAPHGYNLKPGGRNHRFHPDTKLKLSISHKGKKLPSQSLERREATRKQMLGHKYNVGRVCSVETRLKIGKANTGNKYALGVKKSPEECAAICARQTNNPLVLEALARGRANRWNKVKTNALTNL
jgi:group I intron endonuclease